MFVGLEAREMSVFKSKLDQSLITKVQNLRLECNRELIHTDPGRQFSRHRPRLLLLSSEAILTNGETKTDEKKHDTKGSSLVKCAQPDKRSNYFGSWWCIMKNAFQHSR